MPQSILVIAALAGFTVMGAGEAATPTPTPAQLKHNQYTCALGSPYPCNREWLTADYGKGKAPATAVTPEQRKHNLYTCMLGPPHVCNTQWLTAADRKKIAEVQRKTK